jgi:ParB/RepB/Spo0J family partition protein
MQANVFDTKQRLSALSRQVSQEVKRAEASPQVPKVEAPTPAPMQDGGVLDASVFVAPTTRPIPETATDRHVRKLRLADVLDSPFQPRLRPLGRRDVDDLMASIASVGQATPIIASPAPDNRYYVHSGHRRCAALRFLGADTVDADVREDLDERAARRIAISENLGREDLSPYELALALQHYCTACNVSVEAASAELGLKPSTAYRLKALLGASDALQELLRDSAIPAKPAALLAKLDAKNPKKACRLARRYADGKATSADLERALREDSPHVAGSARAFKDVDLSIDDRCLRLRVALERDSLHEEQIARVTQAIGTLLGHLGVAQVAAVAVPAQVTVEVEP